jgi:hypothetical protein
MSVFTVDLANQPGELASLCEAMAGSGVNLVLCATTFRKLADAGVNTDLLLPVRVSDDLFFAVICVDDANKAYSVLGDQIVPEKRPG